jgi:hypothetical protein
MAKKRSFAAPNSAKAAIPREAVEKNSRLRDAGICASIFVSVFFVYFPAIQGTLLWDDSSHITKPQSQFVSGLWRTWAGSNRDAAALSLVAPCVLDATPDLGRCRCRLPSDEHLASRGCGMPGDVHRQTARASGTVAGRVCLCSAPGLRGSSSLDFRTEEHAVRGFFILFPRWFICVSTASENVRNISRRPDYSCSRCSPKR